MGSKKQTAVNLNETAQKIKDELSPIYGLKNILSAGLLLFSRLSDADQKKIIAELVSAHSADDHRAKKQHKKTLQDAIDIIKKTAKMESKRPGQVVELLSKAEQAKLTELLEQLAPEPGKTRKKKEG